MEQLPPREYSPVDQTENLGPDLCMYNRETDSIQGLMELLGACRQLNINLPEFDNLVQPLIVCNDDSTALVIVHLLETKPLLKERIKKYLS